MVGDDVEADVGRGLEAGLRAVLVRPGKYHANLVFPREWSPPPLSLDCQRPGLLCHGDNQ
jgi:ribonucleotide monophosphatase NagD (HAD superfamily)